jgi:1,4-dihydroxy-2-naphthoate octaprenyltransferase
MAERTDQLPSTVQRWFMAARPKTLPAAASPVIVGVALAASEGFFRADLALATLFAGLLLQIRANLANDVFDYLKGTDTSGRLGPVRVTQSGLLSPRQVMAGMGVVFFLAATLGVYLAVESGWPVLAIGGLAILSAIAYTGGPFPYGYYGFGELFVFLFFGLAAVCGSYYIQAVRLTPLAVWSAVPIGLLIVALLVVNNLRDIQTDRAAHKRTLAVRMGERWTQKEYLAAVAAAYAIPLLMWGLARTGAWVMLSWLSIPMAARLVKVIHTVRGRPLNQALAGTGQLVLAFGLLLALGFLLSPLSR